MDPGLAILCEECLETNYTQITADYETCKGSDSETCRAKPTNDGQWSQASLEYNKAYDVVFPENNVYESLS